MFVHEESDRPLIYAISLIVQSSQRGADRSYCSWQLVLNWKVVNYIYTNYPHRLYCSIYCSARLPVFFSVAGCSRNPDRVKRMKAGQIQGHRAVYGMDLWPWRGHSMTYIWLRRPSNRFTFVDHPSLSRLRAATRRLSGSGSVRALVYINTWLCHLGVACSITGSPKKRLRVSLRKWLPKKKLPETNQGAWVSLLTWSALQDRTQSHYPSSKLATLWRVYWSGVDFVSLFVGERDTTDYGNWGFCSRKDILMRWGSRDFLIFMRRIWWGDFESLLRFESSLRYTGYASCSSI